MKGQSFVIIYSAKKTMCIGLAPTTRYFDLKFPIGVELELPNLFVLQRWNVFMEIFHGNIITNVDVIIHGNRRRAFRICPHASPRTGAADGPLAGRGMRRGALAAAGRGHVGASDRRMHPCGHTALIGPHHRVVSAEETCGRQKNSRTDISKTHDRAAIAFAFGPMTLIGARPEPQPFEPSRYRHRIAERWPERQDRFGARLRLRLRPLSVADRVACPVPGPDQARKLSWL